MNALMANWSGLSAQRKVALAAAVLTTLFLTFYIARTATQPQMALLYGGLDQRSAGQVVAALDGLGVRSEVRGDQIFVPEGARDRARLDLARQGLPQMGQAGYELLDQLSGFGTTSEMFQAAYWRAKEGELARTILSVPGVRSARVHIGASSRRPFGRNQQKATAAVTVRTNGGALSEQTAVSIRYLVALAVSNLDASQVAVIDADNGVVLRPGEEKA
ncbi:MAG: flagellar M-ring protein FliF, partial [Pseudomonadota bacterium]